MRETLRIGLVLCDGDVCRLCLCGEEPETPYLPGGLEDTRVVWTGGEERVSLPRWGAGGFGEFRRWRGGGEAEEGGVRLFPGLLPRLLLGDREEWRLATGEGDPLCLGMGEGEPLRCGAGEGESLRLDTGEAHALRLDVGDGDLLCLATGEDDVLRFDTDGDDLRFDIGDGDFLRLETGDGDILRLGGGDGGILRLDVGEGDLLRLGGDPDERLFWAKGGEGGLYRR